MKLKNLSYNHGENVHAVHYYAEYGEIGGCYTTHSQDRGTFPGPVIDYMQEYYPIATCGNMFRLFFNGRLEPYDPKTHGKDVIVFLPKMNGRIAIPDKYFWMPDDSSSDNLVDYDSRNTDLFGNAYFVAYEHYVVERIAQKLED